MPNKLYSKFPGKGDSGKAMGATPSSAMPEKTANWPGPPGKTQKSRSAGTATSGYFGPFQHKKSGL